MGFLFSLNQNCLQRHIRKSVYSSEVDLNEKTRTSSLELTIFLILILFIFNNLASYSSVV